MTALSSMPQWYKRAGIYHGTLVSLFAQFTFQV